MNLTSRSLLRRSALCGALAVSLLAPGLARAQGGSDSATVRLIQLLIEKGILTKGQAASLLTQAQQEARAGAAPRHAPRKAAEEPEAAEAAPKGEVRVTYVPQFVRDQIAQEVRSQMLRQMEDQGWAEPNQTPDWVRHVTVYGDLRLRYQDNIESNGNLDSAGLPYPFPDFNSINGGSGYDTSGTALPPLLNVSENRAFEQVRARLGVHAQISDYIAADIRFGTGNDSDPVSENTTFGVPGDFSKYAIWLDRAYFDIRPLPGVEILAGRQPKPYFLSTLMFAPDLALDGVSLKVNQALTNDLRVYAVGGAYPVFNEALNFSSTELVKGSSRDAYMFAAQGGAEWSINHDYFAKVGLGYFGFSNVSGKVSAPCFLFTTADTCSTDDTRLPYYQFGNTMIPVRDIVVTDTTLTSTPQYYGLASHFGVLDLHGEFDLHNFDPVLIALEGEYTKNLAYNRGYILARNPINNFGSNNDLQSGDTAYLLALTVGYPEISHLWEWNLRGEYRYIASDAFIGSFTDQNFHLGGTNAKGYILTGNLGIGPDTYVSARWSSASVVGGPPDGNDMLQIDLNTSF
jgi:hypothetical protein